MTVSSLDVFLVIGHFCIHDFVNVIELRGPIQREHHHEIISSFEDKGLLRILRMNQLHLSEDKYQEKVKEFVVAERNALKSKILDLI